jgi:hypothetical protein
VPVSAAQPSAGVARTIAVVPGTLKLVTPQPDAKPSAVKVAGAGDVSVSDAVPKSQRYICIFGRPPSAGVLMFALFLPLLSCASPSMASPWTPPRP